LRRALRCGWVHQIGPGRYGCVSVPEEVFIPYPVDLDLT
jgi:hypothetical protein